MTSLVMATLAAVALVGCGAALGGWLRAVLEDHGSHSPPSCRRG
jgi:Flp pilus assembly pilin Flp